MRNGQENTRLDQIKAAQSVNVHGTFQDLLKWLILIHRCLHLNTKLHGYPWLHWPLQLQRIISSTRHQIIQVKNFIQPPIWLNYQ